MEEKFKRQRRKMEAHISAGLQSDVGVYNDSVWQLEPPHLLFYHVGHLHNFSW